MLVLNPATAASDSAEPTITFSSAGHHRPLATLYCFVSHREQTICLCLQHSRALLGVAPAACESHVTSCTSVCVFLNLCVVEGNVNRN